MSGRQLLAAALKEALPTWQHVSVLRPTDTVRKPGACVLWSSKLTRPAKLNLDLLSAELVLWVVTATDNPEKAEDDLDDLLLQVMQALEPLEEFVWTEAERGVLAESFEGWRIVVTANYLIEVTPDPEPEPENP